MSQTLQSVLCITTNKYLVHVLVVLLHARFSVVGPIPFLLAAIFFSVHPYIGSTTVLPDSGPLRGRTSCPRTGCPPGQLVLGPAVRGDNWSGGTAGPPTPLISAC